jgi:hypothetical protein
MNLNRVLDAFPDPWNPRFLILIVSASVVTAAVASLRAGSDAMLPGIAALTVTLLGAFGRLKLNSAASAGEQATAPTGSSSMQGYLMIGAGFVIAIGTLVATGAGWLEWVAVASPFLVLAFCRYGFRPTSIAPLIVIPLLFGFIFLDTAILMGEAAAGGYPAVFTTFLVLVGLTTRRLEARYRDGEAAKHETLNHPVHRSTLALLSTVFFLFGVITLWPWLGKLYGVGYLWILVLGVLGPLLFLWGRMKQPGTDSPLPALVRFNRLLPYIGLVLMVAILFG